MNYKELAALGYEAYARKTGGKTFDGRDMPRWENLPQRTIDAWMAAAAAIREGIIGAVLT